MQIRFDSELMQNSKQATVLQPNGPFTAAKGQNGAALFFSIGTDGVFHLIREMLASQTGWALLDLSSRLHPGTPATCKLFAVSQDGTTGLLDLALVVTAGGTDTLYLALGVQDAPATWTGGMTWQAVPFDAVNHPAPAPAIREVTLVQGTGGRAIVVDVAGAAGVNSRYYLLPGASPRWMLHDLAADLDGSTVSALLGERTHDRVAGTYTIGSIGGTEELLFTPLYNALESGVAVSPARLTLPKGATTIAAMTGAAGTTMLFVAGDGTLHCFTPDNQRDGAQPVALVGNVAFGGLKAMQARSAGGRTAVWGIDAGGSLFYTGCVAGREPEPGAWSPPVPLLAGVTQIATTLDARDGGCTVFAQVSGQELVQLTRDPRTTHWQQRNILLPSTDVTDVVTRLGYTTHVQVTDDDNLGAGLVSGTLTASDAVSVYVNDAYQVLSPTTPLAVTTDVLGVLTIVQETQALACASYRLTLTDGGATVVINPMGKVLATLGAVKNGNDLAKAQGSNTDGSQAPLLPATLGATQRDAAAQVLQQFVAVCAKLPQDGSASPAQGTAAGTAATAAPQVSMTFSGSTSSGGAAGALHVLEVAAGDLFQLARQAIGTVDSFFVTVAGDVQHFFIRIGGELYHTVLDSIATVMHAAELVFAKLEVAIADLARWLGFVFDWKDIVQTHAVLKAVLRGFMLKAIAEMDTAKQTVQAAIAKVQVEVGQWAGLPATPQTLAATTASVPVTSGQHSPQANWALHHLKSNVDGLSTTTNPPTTDLSLWTKALNDVEAVYGQEAETLRTALQTLKSDVIDVRGTLTFDELCKRVVAVVTNALLGTAETLILAGIDVLQLVVEVVLAMLDAPVKIPVLSAAYESACKAELSFLDLVCLVCAIPATVIYRLATGTPLFADDPAAVAALIPAAGAGHGATQKTNAAPAPAMHLNAQLSAQVLPVRAASVDGRDAGTTAQVPAPSSSDGTPSPATTPVSDATYRKLNILMNCGAGSFGSYLVTFCAGYKNDIAEANLAKPTPIPVPYPIAVLSTAVYLPYVGPDIASALNPGSATTWWTIFNDAWTGLAIFKTALDNIFLRLPLDAKENWEDNISPYLEYVINLVWLMPAIVSVTGYAEKKTGSSPATSDWVAFGANLAFDLGGIVAPLTRAKTWELLELVEPAATKAANGVTYAVYLLTLSYGVLCLASGVEAIKESASAQ